jgi:hypothetical protein
LECKSWWAIQTLNLDPTLRQEKRAAQLRELEELRLDAFHNMHIYKERTKRWHDQRVLKREFRVGDKVLLFNSRAKLFPGKLKSRWSGPYEILQVFPYGTVELKDPSGGSFIANGQRIKIFYESELHEVRTIEKIRLSDVEELLD